MPDRNLAEIQETIVWCKTFTGNRLAAIGGTNFENNKRRKLPKLPRTESENFEENSICHLFHLSIFLDTFFLYLV